MIQNVYINQILILEILPWIFRDDDFILEKNGNNGHKFCFNSKICQWKDKHNFNNYLNCVLFFDFIFIKNNWFLVKNEICKILHWDEQITMEFTLEE